MSTGHSALTAVVVASKVAAEMEILIGSHRDLTTLDSSGSIYDRNLDDLHLTLLRLLAVAIVAVVAVTAVVDTNSSLASFLGSHLRDSYGAVLAFHNA